MIKTFVEEDMMTLDIIGYAKLMKLSDHIIKTLTNNPMLCQIILESYRHSWEKLSLKEMLER